MSDAEHENSLGELIHLATDCMGVAVTIIDPKGTLLYYNRQAERILDRKPEYIGTDIHSHHKKAGTNPKIDLMLKNFEEGRKDPFYYEAKPYGEMISVTVAPIIKKDRFVGCVQTVRLKNTVS
jgi:sensor histidine kinase regulating citrate/malate metabolism